MEVLSGGSPPPSPTEDMGVKESACPDFSIEYKYLTPQVGETEKRFPFIATPSSERVLIETKYNLRFQICPPSFNFFFFPPAPPPPPLEDITVNAGSLFLLTLADAFGPLYPHSGMQPLTFLIS